MVAIVSVLALLVLHARVEAQPTDRTGFTGKQLYDAACAACHGPDGRGQSIAVRGFETDPPDFTDCSLTTPEADLDWYSVIHQGGRVRGFDAMMPAFGDELTGEEIERLLEHLRAFCTERGWPHGDLNMPRPFFTEKAFPENEAVLTTTFEKGGGRGVSNELLYEHRLGRRGQYEIFVRDVNEIGGAYKHVLAASHRTGSVVSSGGEVKVDSDGSVLEAFATLSQALPFLPGGFLHAHTGVELPAGRESASKAAFWRVAIGKSFMEQTWGRAWSPMIEILASRPFETGAATEWDVVPQLQLSLSTRQHVLLNVGVRAPLTARTTRQTAALVYVLWDWFDGGLFSGW